MRKIARDDRPRTRFQDCHFIPGIALTAMEVDQLYSIIHRRLDFQWVFFGQTNGIPQLCPQLVHCKHLHVVLVKMLTHRRLAATSVTSFTCAGPSHMLKIVSTASNKSRSREKSGPELKCSSSSDVGSSLLAIFQVVLSATHQAPASSSAYA